MAEVERLDALAVLAEGFAEELPDGVPEELPDELEAAIEEDVALLLARDDVLNPLFELLPDVAELLRLEVPVKEDTNELELPLLDTDTLEVLAEVELAALELREEPADELKAELRLLLLVVMNELLNCELALLPLVEPVDPVLLGCEEVPPLLDCEKVPLLLDCEEIALVLDVTVALFDVLLPIELLDCELCPLLLEL